MRGFELNIIPVCDSTQKEAEQQIIQNPHQPRFAVQTDRQTGGRGSRGRDWVSEEGNLFVSYALPMEDRWMAPHLAGYPVALAISDLLINHLPEGGPRVTLKWPNDVLVGGAKISGTLLTTQLAGGAKWIIVGIGLNVSSHPDGTPYPATHLNEHAEFKGDLCDLADRLGANILVRLEEWLSSGFPQTRQAYLARADALGAPVSIKPRGEDERISGIYHGIADDGAFLLEVDGVLTHHYAGDVFPDL